MRRKKRFVILLLMLVVVIAAIFNINNFLKLYYPLKYTDYIYKYSAKYKLDPYFVAAVIKTESNFDPEAQSDKGAIGLMQITSDTAEWSANEMGITDFEARKLYEPEFNIQMGCWYLNNLSEEFKGNKDLVLAAYNGGRGNVEKWLKNPQHSKDGSNLHYIPFKETDKYVKKVNTIYSIYGKIYKGN